MERDKCCSWRSQAALQNICQNTKGKEKPTGSKESPRLTGDERTCAQFKENLDVRGCESGKSIRPSTGLGRCVQGGSSDSVTVQLPAVTGTLAIEDHLVFWTRYSAVKEVC